MTSTVWEFNTENYRVVCTLEDEDLDPAECFQFDEDANMVRNGDVLWFCAVVTVYKNDHEIGRDVLGGCAYKTVDDFIAAHRDKNPMNRNSSIMRAKRGSNVVLCHYFPEMVHQAIADARATLA